MKNRSSLLSTLVISTVCAATGCSGSDQSMVAVAAAEDNRHSATANSSPTEDNLSPLARNLSISQVVLANWAPDKYWYPAKLEKSEAGKVVVRYYDNTVETLAKDRVVAETLKAGDRVYVDWRKRGHYYAATVTTRKGDLLTVRYDDGTEEKSRLEAVRLERQDRSGRMAWVASDPTNYDWSSQPYRPQMSPRPLLQPQFFGGDVRSTDADGLEAAAEAEARETAARAVRNYQNQVGGW